MAGNLCQSVAGKAEKVAAVVHELMLRLDPAPELEFHLRQKAVSPDQPRQRIGGDDWRADR